MKTVCIIQARMGSTRLPNKVAMPILGKPMLAHQLERDAFAKRVNALIVATTDKPEDDVVEEIAKECGVEVFRGSETDVLDRYYQAAKQANADVVVRVTGDCPLHYGEVIDESIERFLNANVDYARSPANYPEGLDTEVFRFSAFEKVWNEAKLPSEREHATPYFYTHPELFTLDAKWKPKGSDLSGMHWSVDTPQDFQFVTNIFEALYLSKPHFVKEDVFEVLKAHPEWLEINKGQTGYEGYTKSLGEDTLTP